MEFGAATLVKNHLAPYSCHLSCWACNYKHSSESYNKVSHQKKLLHNVIALKRIDVKESMHKTIVMPQIVPTISPSELNMKQLLDSCSGTNIMETACNILDQLIATFLANPRRLNPSNDPQIQLSGNYAPVAETPPTRCMEVEGEIPSDLNGIYIRNGPNPTRLFASEGYHMFDGDGMLHGISINSRSATYCSRFVRTSRFIQEELANRPLFIKFFGGLYGSISIARMSLFLIRTILGLLNMSEGWGLSNTSVCFFNNKIMSLSEEDMPYIIHVTPSGDILTVGRFNFPQPSSNTSSLKFKNMCAHPKFDPSTGEMFAFSFRPSLPYPFYFYKVSPNGEKSGNVPIPLRGISFIHDFAITKNFVIFPDHQFVIKPSKVLRGQLPVIYDEKKVSKFCVIERSTTMTHVDNFIPTPIWFDAPNCNCYHCINAWEENDEIVMIIPIISPPENFLEIPAKNLACHISEVRLNLTTRSTSIKKLSNENLEFGTFNQLYTGQKMRYVYLAVGSYPEISSIVKVDVQAHLKNVGGKLDNPQDCIVAKRDFGESHHASEPFFVPRTSNEGVDVVEDDGYILCLVHNHITGESNLIIMDAQSPSLAILSSIKLPTRVPYGFHGCFIHEHQLLSQTM